MDRTYGYAVALIAIIVLACIVGGLLWHYVLVPWIIGRDQPDGQDLPAGVTGSDVTLINQRGESGADDTWPDQLAAINAELRQPEPPEYSIASILRACRAVSSALNSPPPAQWDFGAWQQDQDEWMRREMATAGQTWDALDTRYLADPWWTRR